MLNSVEANLGQIYIQKTSTRTRNILQIRSAQNGIAQVCANEVGSSEHRFGEIGLSERRIPKLAAP